MQRYFTFENFNQPFVRSSCKTKVLVFFCKVQSFSAKKITVKQENRFRQVEEKSLMLKYGFELLKFCFRYALSQRILYDLIERVFIRCLSERQKKHERNVLYLDEWVCVFYVPWDRCAQRIAQKIDNMNKLFDYWKLCSSCSFNIEDRIQCFISEYSLYSIVPAPHTHVDTLCIACRTDVQSTFSRLSKNVCSNCSKQFNFTLNRKNVSVNDDEMEIPCGENEEKRHNIVDRE